jgi:hypothetical protein
LGRRRFRGWHGKRLRRKLVCAAAAVAAIAGAATGVLWWPQSQSQTAVKEPTNLSAEISYFNQLENDFFSSLGASLGELDATATTTHYLQRGDDVWVRELNALQRDIGKLESTTVRLPE